MQNSQGLLDNPDVAVEFRLPLNDLAVRWKFKTYVDILVVVDTEDALLIVPRERAQKVVDLVKALEAARRDSLL